MGLRRAKPFFPKKMRAVHMLAHGSEQWEQTLHDRGSYRHCPVVIQRTSVFLTKLCYSLAANCAVQKNYECSHVCFHSSHACMKPTMQAAMRPAAQQAVNEDSKGS